MIRERRHSPKHSAWIGGKHVPPTVTPKIMRSPHRKVGVFPFSLQSRAAIEIDQHCRLESPAHNGTILPFNIDLLAGRLLFDAALDLLRPARRCKNRKKIRVLSQFPKELTKTLGKTCNPMRHKQEAIAKKVRGFGKSPKG